MFRLSNPGKVGTLMRARKQAHRMAARYSREAKRAQQGHDAYIKIPRRGAMVADEIAKAKRLEDLHKAKAAQAEIRGQEASKLKAQLDELGVFGTKKKVA